MLLKEVMQVTGLSKKAIQYYEEKGLIQPKRLANGYRDYDEVCIKKLQEISVLRSLDFDVPDILKILTMDYVDDVYDRAKHYVDEKTNQLQLQKYAITELQKSQSIAHVEKLLQQDVSYPYFYTHQLHYLYGTGNLIMLLVAFLVVKILNFPVMPSLLLPFCCIVIFELYMEHMLFHSSKPYAFHVQWKLQHFYKLFLISLLRSLMMMVVLDTAMKCGYQWLQYLSLLWLCFSILACYRPIWRI